MKRSRNGSKPKRKVVHAQPPPFTSTIVVTKVVRFSATALGTNIVSGASLQSVLSVGNNTNSSTLSLASAVKLHSVEVWAPPPQSSAPTTLTLEWLGNTTTGIVSNNRIISDTALGSTVCAHVKGKPPVGSLPSFWVDDSAGNLFQIAAPAGSIVDVTASWQITGSSTHVSAVATSANGQVYELALDGPATNNLVPMAFVTTH